MSKIIKHCLIDDSNDDLTFTKDHAELCALIPLLKLTGNEYMIGTKRVLLKLNGKNACVKIGGGNKRFNEWLPEKIWHEATTFKKLMKYNNLSFSAAINKFPCEDAKQRNRITYYAKNVPTNTEEAFFKALERVSEHKKKLKQRRKSKTLLDSSFNKSLNLN
jgi:hypothetical protein